MCVCVCGCSKSDKPCATIAELIVEKRGEKIKSKCVPTLVVATCCYCCSVLLLVYLFVVSPLTCSQAC